MTRYRADDVDLLLPTFASQVRLVLAALKDLGYDPVPFDTLRTPAEALRNAKRGTGVIDSMHLYGVACDVICGDHGWDCQKHKCPFYQDLGKTVESLGLTWGGRFTRRDLPHFQGVSVKEQAVFRALRSATEREGYLRARP